MCVFGVLIIDFLCLQVCVEFEDEPWEKRAWIDVYGSQVKLFLVEHKLAIADRKCPSNPSMSVLCPGMVSIASFSLAAIVIVPLSDCFF